MTMPLIDGPVGIHEAVLHDASARARIDGYVRAHPDATPFHLTGWNVAVARGCGQRAHCLVTENGSGAITGILPLTEIASPLFGRALVSTGFGVGGGILADDEASVAALAAAGWALAEARRCPSLELRGGPVPGPDWQVDEGAYLGFARDIAADDAAELLAIPRKQRAEVRKALANDLDIRVSRDTAARKAHYSVYAQSVRNLGTPVFPARLFSEVLDELSDSSDILVVSDKGAPIASVLSLYMNGTVYPYWGGGTAAARGLRGNDAMYFALMRHARQRGCTRFDFGRSKVGTGPAAFKKNWGFDGVPLRYAMRTAGDGQAREINPLNPKFRLMVAAWKRLPMPVANFAGPWISRGLG
ncbi:MAG: FemAB family XrtA/PEP-CTERM system-associated protein [Sphingomonas sp.]|jgi:FemAB-related protein (PEP-CTERM system-associated)